MKKDGTRYLCDVEFENGDRDFLVLYWDKPAAPSDIHQVPGWCVSGGLKVKIKKIFCYRNCNSIFPVQVSLKGKL